MKHRTQNNNRGRGDSRRRKSRKSGRRTAMVLLSVIVAGAVVFAVAHRGCSDSPVADETEAFLNASQWSDTLTNAASELALLRPMDKEIETFMARH